MRAPILVSVSFLCLLVVVDKAVAQETEANIIASTTSEATVTLSDDSEHLTNPILERSSHAHSHVHVEPALKGFWTKKFAWRPRWVKTWQEKKIYVAVWKRMWGPAVLKEWVPVPRPPPGWIKHNSGAYAVKKYPYHY
ncbi:uncharacterized protein LOC126380248 [Pectinophora gossypiella]|uniref:uncharacterized protein LOC126380248 n=1 Tax=Pectinophora gossypiella TaxID=13191 RepID=UPI00214E5D1B|nr:uncharacterized protein LOC126380248 [Pectinophora gossypiella]